MSLLIICCKSTFPSRFRWFTFAHSIEFEYLLILYKFASFIVAISSSPVCKPLLLVFKLFVVVLFFLVDETYLLLLAAGAVVFLVCILPLVFFELLFLLFTEL